MAKLPDKTSLGPRPELPTRRNRNIASINVGPVGDQERQEGRQLEQLGKQIGDFGNQLANIHLKNQEFEAERAWQEFKTNTLMGADQAKQTVSPDGIRTFAGEQSAGFEAAAREYMASIPAHLQAEHDSRLVNLNSQLQRSAIGFQARETAKIDMSRIESDVAEKMAPRVASADEATFANEVAEMQALVAASSVGGSTAGAEFEHKLKRDLWKAHIEGMAADDLDALLKKGLPAAVKDALDPSDVAAAKKLVATKRREYKFQAKNAVDDDLESIARTGQPVVQPDQEAALLAALTPGEVEAWKTGKQNARVFYELTNDMASLSQAEMEERVQFVLPEDGEPGYSNKFKLYESVSDARDRVMLQRQKDAAAAIRGASHVTLAYNEIDPQDPQTYEDAVKVSLREQERVGVPAIHQRVLTKGEALELAQPLIEAGRLNEPEELVDAEIDAIEKIAAEIEARYGPYAERAADEILQATSNNKTTRTALSAVLLEIKEGNFTPSAGAAADAESAVNAAERAAAPIELKTELKPAHYDLLLKAAREGSVQLPDGVTVTFEEYAENFDSVYGTDDDPNPSARFTSAFRE